LAPITSRINSCNTLPSFFFNSRVNIIVPSPDLGYSKAFARWLPQILKFTQRSKEGSAARGESLLSQIVSGLSLGPHFEPEYKRQSMKCAPHDMTKEEEIQ
jgi:hypothetical protein